MILSRRSSIVAEFSHDYSRLATITTTTAHDWATITLRPLYDLKNDADSSRMFWTCPKQSWSLPNYHDQPRFLKISADFSTTLFTIYHDLKNRGESWPKSWQCKRGFTDRLKAVLLVCLIIIIIFYYRGFLFVIGYSYIIWNMLGHGNFANLVLLWMAS